MKKIMFSDKFGLTQAVLEGRKTQTRRLVKAPKFLNGIEVRGFHICTLTDGRWWTELYDEDERKIENSRLTPPYKVGEVVAVAQRYSELYDNPNKKISYGCYKDTSAWNNKMFVKAEMMPHQIKITNVRLERLQDISWQDCLDEGIVKDTMEHDEFQPEYFYHFGLYNDDSYESDYKTPQEAYAALIDKLSGKGTWDGNPWVWVYEFDLVKSL